MDVGTGLSEEVKDICRKHWKAEKVGRQYLNECAKCPLYVPCTKTFLLKNTKTLAARHEGLNKFASEL